MSRFKKHPNKAQAFGKNVVVAIDIDYATPATKHGGDMFTFSPSETAVVVKN